jgi:hypothetical protein
MSFEIGVLGAMGVGALAAFQRVREAALKASAFLLRQTTVENMSEETFVAWHAKHGHLPLGIQRFKLQHMSKSKHLPVAVPYRMIKGSGYAVIRHALVWFNYAGRRLTVYSLRGTLHIEQFVVSIAELAEIIRNTEHGHNRGYVEDYAGRDIKETPTRIAGSVTSGRDALDESSSDNYLRTEQFIRFADESAFSDPEQVDPFEGLAYPDCVYEELDRLKKWQSKRDWYAEKGIPFRRGLLLYGPGGTGKTTLVVALSKALNLKVCRFFLGTMSDQEFLRDWDSVSTSPNIVLFEDFDAVFHGRENVSSGTLSFDVLLNAISGVSAADGVLLIITTNNIEHIDPALGVADGKVSTRPGRIDSALYLGTMDEKQIRAVSAKMLSEWPSAYEGVVQQALALPHGCTGAQLRELCVQRAFELMD